MSKIEDPIAYIAAQVPPGGRILYMPNGGNLGDNLIAAATVQKLSACGVPWQFVLGGSENARDGDVLVYGGGGSLVPLYKGGIDCLRFLLSLRRPLYVLPHTVRGHQDFWLGAANITVFCRDLASYDYLGRYKNVGVHLSDDMATNLDISKDPFSGVCSLRDWHRNGGDARILRAFRGDGESARPRGLFRNLDVSELTAPTFASGESIYANAVLFLAAIASYSMVETDRLHVAVAAGLLGLEVRLYDNSYGKNAAVFENTLKHKFPSLHLMAGSLT